MDNDLNQFIHDIPKAELHVHIEGTLEPELKFEIARCNNVILPFKSSYLTIEEKQAYIDELDNFMSKKIN